MREGYESTELMYSGHLACAGCGATIAMRYALKALGDDTVIVLPACCWSSRKMLFFRQAIIPSTISRPCCSGSSILIDSSGSPLRS